MGWYWKRWMYKGQLLSKGGQLGRSKSFIIFREIWMCISLSWILEDNEAGASLWKITWLPVVSHDTGSSVWVRSENNYPVVWKRKQSWYPSNKTAGASPNRFICWWFSSDRGPFKCYGKLFSWKFDTTAPPRHVEMYFFVTCFPGKPDTPHPTALSNTWMAPSGRKEHKYTPNNNYCPHNLIPLMLNSCSFIWKRKRWYRDCPEYPETD